MQQRKCEIVNKVELKSRAFCHTDKVTIKNGCYDVKTDLRGLFSRAFVGSTVQSRSLQITGAA